MRLEPLAKPSGITLEDHTANVILQAESLLSHFSYVVSKYASRTESNLIERLRIACEYHDIGKKHPRWQNAVQCDYRLFVKWQKINGGSFNEYKKAVKNTAPNLMKAQIRHEIASILTMPELPDTILVAIAAHHKKLSLRHQAKWDEKPYLLPGSPEVWSKLKTIGNKYIRRPSKQFRSALDDFYEYAGIRSLLQLADVRASILESQSGLATLNKYEYSFPATWSRKPVQKIAEKHWNDELLLIRAPTGAGKTHAALLWASKQIEENRADRLIIAMPTRFTSNALAISVQEDLSETGLYHSSAWNNKFYHKVKEGGVQRDMAMKTHELARKLLTPVTVSTIDHLMMCLTLTREDHHSIAFNMAHSCVVIDEADFYDQFTQANILVLLKALNQWKVPVMIMSASLPDAALAMYQSTGYTIENIKEDTSDYERDRCEIQSIINYKTANDVHNLLLLCTKQPAIIYVNTVAKAIEFYNWFRDNTSIIPIVYHSRYTEPDKLKKEKDLLQNLGKEAWNNSSAKGVAILTQIGEMSINISAELMITDVCPIDRLVQRAGRLCRFDKKVGKLYVMIPYQRKEDSQEIYPAPYGFFNKGWTISPYLEKTIKMLEIKKYNAKNFVEMINLVYDKIEDFSIKTRKNANLLIDQFVYNWIVLPKAISEIDNSETPFWKSRDIGNSEAVLIKVPDRKYYSTYEEWQSFNIEHSINLPLYIIRQGIKHNYFYHSKIQIRKDELPIICATDDLYKFEIGLFFDKNDTNNQIT